MDHIPSLLVDLAIALSTAAVTTLVSRRLKLPVIFGYLMAGLVVGPNMPIPLSASAENVSVMAELGVILIMFGIGMEFSIKKVIEAGPTAILMASVQTFFVMTAGITVGKVLGWGTMEGIFIGAGMIATSTVVIVKLFEETRPPKALRETVFSVTIIHDLYAIILMTVLIALTKVGVKGLSLSEIGLILLKFILFLGGIVGVGRFFIPQFLRKLADKEKHENLVIASIGFCFFLAILAVASGFSLAIGAFAAGMLAAESGREKLIEKLIMPIRDVFTALFFVSVGMLLVPKDVFAYLHIIILFVIIVVVVNAIALTTGGLFAGKTFRNSFQSSIALGQFGEFAFVMMNIGIGAGVVRPELFSVTVSVAVITALTSMYLFKSSGHLADAIEARIPDSLRASHGLYQVWLGSLRNRGLHKGEGGVLLKTALFLIFDSLAIMGLGAGYRYTTNKFPAWIGNFNDWSHGLINVILAILLGSGIALLAISLIKRGRMLALYLASMAPNPEVAGGGRGGRHILAGVLRVAFFLILGVPTLIVLQVFVPMGPLFFVAFISLIIMVTTQIHKARRLTKDVPIGTEWLLAKLAMETKHGSNEVASDRSGTFRIVRLSTKTPGIGSPLSELRLPERTGVTIVTILRDGQNQVPLNPSPNLHLNDRVVLSGSEHALSEAVDILNGQ